MTLKHALCAGAALVLAAPGPALAEPDSPPVDLSGEVIVDLAAVLSGGNDHGARALTKIDVSADMDLARLTGWRGATARITLLDNRGARPNDAAGTLQGVDNIEVARAGLRLFEAWIEQDLGKGASLRAGLYDTNSEFYNNPAAALLIAPPFGIGSELAATGPNGPSIFPSTALAARLFVPLDGDGHYVRLGVVNARASTLGDPGGIDLSFRDGLLLIGETGRKSGRWRWSLGGWHYTRDADDFADTLPDGTPVRRPSFGGYATLEGELATAGPRAVSAFLRVGLSAPYTTPYSGGVQTGVLVSPAFTGRPDSQFSLGVHHAWTGSRFRSALRAGGGVPANETVIELTYADTLLPALTLQPDLQWIHKPGGDAAARDAVLGTVRLTWGF